MAFVIVTFKDGSKVALTAAQYVALDVSLVSSVRLVGPG